MSSSAETPTVGSGRREPLRVGLAFAISMVIFIASCAALALSGTAWFFMVVLLYPTVMLANYVARALTGVDLQKRWFR